MRYSPDKDWSGTDIFGYTISDGMGGADTATVTVTVISVFDPIVADVKANGSDEKVVLGPEQARVVSR